VASKQRANKRKTSLTPTKKLEPRARQRAPRRAPNLEETVQITIELLEQHGETGFRLEHLMERTGISKSSIYLHFGDRDGLLAAAYGKRFEGIVVESISGLEVMLSRVHDSRTTRDALRAATAFVASGERFKHRLDRAVVIAGTRGRPEFRDALAKAQTALTDRFMLLLVATQERGLIRLKHPPRTVAQMIQAVTFGRIIAEIEGNETLESREAWMALVDELLDNLLFDGLLND
jgi:AcrR family transcriptional regulator